MSSIPGYLTVREAADIIGVDASQVRRYCIEERLAAVKVGKTWLIKQDDVKKFDRPPMGNPNLLKR